MSFVNETMVLAVLSLLFYYLLADSRKMKFLRGLPGRKILPIIGQFLALPKYPKDLLPAAKEHHKKYGDRMSLVAGPFQFMWLTHPDDVGKVLSSKDKTTDKPWLYGRFFADWLGGCLFNKLGKEYFAKRRKIMPAFDFGILENCNPVFNKVSNIFVDILKEKEAKGETVEIHSFMTLCALDIICESSMGTSVNSLTDLDNEYAVANHQEQNILFERAISPWLWMDSVWKISPLHKKEKVTREIMQDFVDKIVRERKAAILSEQASYESISDNNESSMLRKSKLAFLDLLIHKQLQGEPGFSDKEIRDETNFFIFAGHDTTAANMTWTTYLLASNPEEQAKVHRELDFVLGGDRTKNIGPSDLSQLKYLECCIKEALRLYPSVAYFARKIEKDFELDTQTTIPKGTDVLFVPWLTHRHPDFFSEPEEFRPSRFLAENSAGRHSYAFIPFSGGPRNCMGQKFALAEAKTVLANLFRNFHFEMENPKEKVIPMPNSVLIPMNGVKVKLSLR